MFRKLILLLILMVSCFTFAQEEPTTRLKGSMGMGLFSRLDREVNPDFYQLHHVPELYGKLHRGRWGLIVDLGRERTESSSGSMSITHQSTNLNAWGRYDLDQNPSWAPFASAGVGVYFDRVTSNYGSATDERDGRRGLFGLGAGLSGFWKVVEVELEGRLSFIQDRKDPQMASMLRLGYQFSN